MRIEARSRLAVWAAALVGVSCAQPPPPPEPPRPTPVAVTIDQGALVSRIKRHFESSGQIPSDVNVELLGLSEAGIGTLQRGVLRLSKDEQEQELDFLVSNEGRWFLRVEPVDLTIDPIARVVDVIEIGPRDPMLGSADARVTIVEYSDFQCPFCARAEAIVHDEVLKAYGDRVRFVYKQMPLVSIHPWAQAASAIGLCVHREGGNDAYWKYHREVFRKQGDVDADEAEEQLLAIAVKAGVEKKAVASCFEAGETAETITATLAEAEELQVNSTPTFFINGRRLSGARPLEAFKAVIEPELEDG